MTRPRLLVVGGGGHAKVVIDTLRCLGEHEIVGCTESDSARKGQDFAGIPILVDDSVWEGCLADGVRCMSLGVGDNRRRCNVGEAARRAGFHLPALVHPHAWVSPSAKLGGGVIVMAGAVIQAEAEIGDDVIINTGATVDHDCVVGSGAHIAPGVHLCGNVLIGVGALMGVGCCVVPGAEVGEWAIVGAGSTVIDPVPPGLTFVGTPAVQRT